VIQNELKVFEILIGDITLEYYGASKHTLPD